MSTCVPFSTAVPSAGLELITVPVSASENFELTLPSWRPACLSVFDASSRVCPTSRGTATFAVPLLKTSVTVFPRDTGEPAAGSVLMTWLAVTLSEFVGSSFRCSPRRSASDRTWAIGCPTQFGRAKVWTDGEGDVPGRSEERRVGEEWCGGGGRGGRRADGVHLADDRRGCVLV